MFNDSDRAYRRTRAHELSVDVSCDYVLPDYLGEVRKILFTEARAVPLPAYMNGEDACVSGTVHFKMVYMDSENRLSSAEFSEDYETVEHLLAEGLIGVSAHTCVQGYSMRLLGPRKISAKARVEAHLAEVSECENEVRGVLEGGEIEVATDRILVADTVICESTEREYAEELTFLEGAISDEIEIPYSTVDSVVEDCRVKDGEIWVSGEHTVSALVKCGDEPVYLMKREIPFAESFSADSLADGMYAICDAYTTSVKLNRNPTDTGTSLTVSLIVEYTPTALGNREATVVTDGYMKDRGTHTEHAELEVEELIYASTISERAESTAALESLSLLGIRDLLSVGAEVGVSSIEACDGGIRINCDVRFSGVACEVNEDSAVTYLPLKHTAKLTKVISLDSGKNGEIRAEIVPRAYSPEGHIDGDNVCLGVTVMLDVAVYEKKSYKTLASIEATEEVFDSFGGKTIYVYYPDADDTLFSVARKFHTTTEKIAIDNALTESAVADKNGSSSLAGVNKLIIK